LGQELYVNVLDISNSVCSDLGDLDWRRYLTAMWIICDVLRSLYSEELLSGENLLMVSTLELVRDTALTAETKDEANRTEYLVTRAENLYQDWDGLFTCYGEQTSVGLTYARATFRAICQEIGGTTRPDGYDDARQFAPGAVAERRRMAPPGRPGPIWINNPSEVVDNSDPDLRILLSFQNIIADIARAQPPKWDPRQIRIQIPHGAF
jgi:hypothetical protein